MISQRSKGKVKLIKHESINPTRKRGEEIKSKYKKLILRNSPLL
jgi:ribosomal protein L17